MHDDELHWDDVRYFVAACRAGSMAAAARAVGVEQSTMSRRIKRLERALGVQLFERRTDGLRPTERAEQLRSHAEEAHASIEALRRAAADGTDGVVRLATTEMMAELLILPAMGEFLQENPGVRIELLTGLPFVDVLGGEADIAVRNVRPTDDALVSRRLVTLEFAPFAARHYLASHPQVPLTELDWITVTAPAGTRLPETQWHEAHIGTPPRLTTTTFKAQLDAVRRGLGVGLLTRAAVSSVDEVVELVEVPASPRLPTFDLWLVTHRDRRQLAHVRAVIDWLVALCAPLETPTPRM